MLVRQSRLRQWLINEVPITIIKSGANILTQNITYFNFLSGADPPTHQSTIALNAFKLSSRPFFCAIPRSVSSARVLCKGLVCAMSVSADRRSESVPPASMRCRKAASEAEEASLFAEAPVARS